MKLKKVISISLILIMIIYIILSSFEGIGNTAFAGQYVSVEDAEKMCPGISSLVNNLKSAHSGYNFQFYNTGIDWGEAILREYQGHGVSPKNLFNTGTKYSGMWYCPVCGQKSYDNGTLCCASMDALRYMMDPRNSISEDSVFQFKSLETPDVGYDDIARVVNGTFLNDTECINAIVEASTAYNVNGFYLVAKMLTEHGTNGSTLSKGVVKDGVIYYNFFNIGAYGNGASTIITNGTNYAANAGWNTKRLSILGGAQVVRASYIGKGQNTCYYQKFNVVNYESGLFSHQYAQNILSAENEGRKFKSYYTINGEVKGNHTFIIPLYTNMPKIAQSRPSTATVNSITYETAVVTANGGLKVRSGEGLSATQIGAIAQNVTVKVLIRAANSKDGHYWDLVISDSTGICGYVARKYINKTGSGSNSGAATPNEYVEEKPSVTPPANTQKPTTPVEAEGEIIKISGAHFEVSAETNVEQILEKYPKAIITDNTGMPTTKICTGYNLTVDGVNYSLVKKGDVNGDGNINVLDAASMVNHIKETKLIEDESRLEAAKIKCNETITVTDIAGLLNYIKENVTDIKIK